MNRMEILLRGYHIWSASKLNITHGLGLDFSPFSSLIQQFYEIVWLVEHETATKLVMERDKRKWIELEFKPIHGVSVPPSLKEQWSRAMVPWRCVGD